jgi:hydrogenase maturation factor
MNLVYGEVVEVIAEDGMRMGKIRIRGAIKKVSLDLLTDAGPRDRVLICDGIAISKVTGPPDSRDKTLNPQSAYVPGHSR